MNNSYRLLETEAAEPIEFCLPTSIFPEKRKSTVQLSKPKSERKERTQSALKVAGKGPSLVSNPTVTNTKEMAEVVEDTCDTKTSALTGRQQSAAAEA